MLISFGDRMARAIEDDAGLHAEPLDNASGIRSYRIPHGPKGHDAIRLDIIPSSFGKFRIKLLAMRGIHSISVSHNVLSEPYPDDASGVRSAMQWSKQAIEEMRAG